MGQETVCVGLETSDRRKKLRNISRKNRIKLRTLLNDPMIRRRFLIYKTYKNLSRWQKFMYRMSLAEFLFENEKTSPEYRINWAGVVVWVFLLCLAAFLLIR